MQLRDCPKKRPIVSLSTTAKDGMLEFSLFACVKSVTNYAEKVLKLLVNWCTSFFSVFDQG